MGVTVEAFPFALLDRARRGLKRCSADGCLKPEIAGRGFCQLHARLGRIQKRARKSELKDGQAYVYAVRCGDFIKIGQTQAPKKRFATLQGANPFEIEYLGHVILGMEDEFLIHEFLDDHRHRHEWFRSTPDVLRMVDLIVTGNSEAIRGLILFPQC